MDEIDRVIPGNHSCPVVRCSKVNPAHMDGDANPTRPEGLLQAINARFSRVLAAAAKDLVEAYSRGHGDVQARHDAAHRETDEGVAATGDGLRETRMFAAHEKCHGGAEIGLEQACIRLVAGADTLYAVFTEPVEGLGKIANLRERHLLGRPGRDFADRRPQSGSTVSRTNEIMVGSPACNGYGLKHSIVFNENDVTPVDAQAPTPQLVPTGA